MSEDADGADHPDPAALVDRRCHRGPRQRSRRTTSQPVDGVAVEQGREPDRQAHPEQQQPAEPVRRLAVDDQQPDAGKAEHHRVRATSARNPAVPQADSRGRGRGDPATDQPDQQRRQPEEPRAQPARRSLASGPGRRAFTSASAARARRGSGRTVSRTATPQVGPDRLEVDLLAQPYRRSASTVRRRRSVPVEATVDRPTARATRGRAGTARPRRGWSQRRRGRTAGERAQHDPQQQDRAEVRRAEQQVSAP